MRIFLTLIMLLIAQPSFAATTTTSNILGFSKDGRYFVFEEFAVYDGAGIPKASLYITDTTNDSWLPGSPFRTRRGESPDAETTDYAEYERQQITSVRQEVREKAASILAKIAPLVPATQRASNYVYDFTSGGQKVRFSLLDYIQTLNSPLARKVWQLELDTIPFPKRDDCFDLMDKIEGFRLRLVNETDGSSRIISEDTRIPKSRPCPSGYSIEQVVSYSPDRDTTILAILIRFAHPGFEGADGSLLAVTARIKNER